MHWLDIVIKVAHKAIEENEKRHAIDAEITAVADDVGTSVDMRLRAGMPKNTVGQLRLAGMWSDLKAVASDFADEDGDFVAVANVVGSTCHFYLPYGAIKHRSAGLFDARVDFFLRAPNVRSATGIGHSEFKLALPAPRPWRRVEYLWPLIGLCMSVARADGRLEREEIRYAKEFLSSSFGLGEEDLEGLRVAMKAAHPAALAEQVRACRRRIPGLIPSGVLSFLVQLGRADGALAPQEIHVLQEIGRHLGVDEAEAKRIIRP